MASDAPWRTEGSVLIGLALVRSGMGVEGGIKEQAHAKVVGWLSAAESDFEDTRGNPAPLYRIKYLDGALAGDEEDLGVLTPTDARSPAEVPVWKFWARE